MPNTCKHFTANIVPVGVLCTLAFGPCVWADDPVKAAPAPQAANQDRVHVPDAGDFLQDVGASHVANVVAGNCLPFERDPSNLPMADMVYADRRGFTQTTPFATNDPWNLPLSVGGLSTGTGDGQDTLALRIHDSLGNSTQADLTSVTGSWMATDPNTTPSVVGRSEISASHDISDFQEANAPATDGRLGHLIKTVTDLQHRLSLTPSKPGADTGTGRSGLQFNAIRPSDPNGMNAAVLGWRENAGGQRGLSLSADVAPIFGDGVDHRLTLGWNGGTTSAHGGGVRFAGGRAGGETFDYTTLTQSLYNSSSRRTTFAVSSFSVDGHRWNEAIFTSARAVGKRSEFGYGLAVQQGGAGPFISWAQPVGRDGKMAISLGAPSSIATRSPITLQYSCPL